MKNILFVYSSLKENGSETTNVLSQVEQYISNLKQEGITVEHYDLGTLYQEDPHEIVTIVNKAFKAIDKKRLSPEQNYQEKLLVLARYTKRLSRDLMRVTSVLTHKAHTVKVFSRNLRNHPVIPYNESIHNMVDWCNPEKILETHRNELIKMDVLMGGSATFLNGRRDDNFDFKYQDLPLSAISDIYSDVLSKRLGTFADFLNVYLINKYINEYLHCDTIVFGVPIYNHNIPSRLQNYLNYFVRAGITFSNANPTLNQNDFFKKEVFAAVACGGAREDYQQFVEHFFTHYMSYLGSPSAKVFMLPNRVETNKNAQAESDALVARLCEELVQSIETSKNSIFNVPRLRSNPNYANFPRLEDFFVHYQLNADPNLLGEAFRGDIDLLEHEAFLIPAEEVVEMEQALGKKNVISVAFTNFVYCK